MKDICSAILNYIGTQLGKIIWAIIILIILGLIGMNL